MSGYDHTHSPFINKGCELCDQLTKGYVDKGIDKAAWEALCRQVSNPPDLGVSVSDETQTSDRLGQ